MSADKSMYPLPRRPEIITVTPELAGDWLDHRNHQYNRRMSAHVVGRYAADMAAGRWKLTPEGLLFDTEGLIISGQHRLQALRNARVTLPFWVFPDQARDIFDVVDQGYKRSAAQALHVPNASTVAAAARYLASLRPGAKTFGWHSRISNPEIVATVAAWPELTWRSTSAMEAQRRAAIPRGPHLAVMGQAERSSYRNYLDSWIEGLTTGANLPAGDPRGHLRNRFMLQGKALRGSGNRPEVYSLIVKAWNAYVTDRRLSVLRWSTLETIPSVIGLDEPNEEGKAA